MSTTMNQKEKLSKDDDAEKVDEGLFRSLIGCIMYLSATRPDILFAISLLSHFMHCDSDFHSKKNFNIHKRFRWIWSQVWEMSRIEVMWILW